MALQHVFAEPVVEGRTKQLFVLLAEEAGAEKADEVLPIVANGAKTARVYSFALGPRSNQSLARRIAKGETNRVVVAHQQIACCRSACV